MTDFTLAELDRLIALRAKAMPEESWTASLLAKGPARVAKKFGEEAVEAVIAAVEGDSAALQAEAADVLYHLLVMLKSRRCTTGGGDGRTAAPHSEIRTSGKAERKT